MLPVNLNYPLPTGPHWPQLAPCLQSSTLHTILDFLQPATWWPASHVHHDVEFSIKSWVGPPTTSFLLSYPFYLCHRSLNPEGQLPHHQPFRSQQCRWKLTWANLFVHNFEVLFCWLLLPSEGWRWVSVSYLPMTSLPGGNKNESQVNSHHIYTF